MTARITKSRDPILTALKAEHLEALHHCARVGFDTPAWDAAIDSENEIRRRMTSRLAMFRPRRVRKAERKATEMSRIVRYVAAQPAGFRNHVPATALSIENAARAGSYRDHLILWRGFIYKGDAERRENVAAHKEAMQWARYHRLVAAECGRRLP